MKKKLSTYWWCQIGGWSAYFIFNSIPYFTPDSHLGIVYLAGLFLTLILGILITHTMRFFMIKYGLLRLNIPRQIFFIFITTAVFSVIFSLVAACIDEVFSKNPNQKSWQSISGLSSYFFIVLTFWNMIYFIYYYIEKSRKQHIDTLRLEDELKIQQLEGDKAKAEFQRNVADVSLTALRSQMNPHFIFNCLNSIKLYTTQNDNVAAAVYLTKFSRLIRLVLENSPKDKVELRSELESLQLYIEMEVMRFKEKLQYNIHVETNVETDYIEIPPLLLQPYVENAIWHGLMPKEEGGKIDINVSVNDDRSCLQISITDNGIGRKKSEDLKSKTAIKHKSYGMKVTSERIALINQIYKTGADVKIHDLIDGEGNASGTKVTIQIPV
jgi:sensor histidine kinase YesM